MNCFKILASIGAASVLLACASLPAGQTPRSDRDMFQSAGDALRAYFAEVDRSDWPRAPGAVDWPVEQRLTRIAVASCRSQEAPAPILDVLASRDPDLFLYVGDNVYGDVWSLSPDMETLLDAYAALSRQADFQRVSRTIPIMATWDDHDYGLNDAGGSFYGKYGAEALFETYWGMEHHPVAERDGVYYSQTFGPIGERVQIIMLDTRFFRTDLTRTPRRNAAGMERYIPSDDPDQDMLGSAQWHWLQSELQEPADIRLLVSSIQVLADGHGWEAWKQLPLSQQRLFQTIAESEANGVILVSGDRHLSALYRQDGIADYPLYELTASSLNRAVREQNDEMSGNQLGPAYAPENFGEIGIDWESRMVILTVRDTDGATVREQTIAFEEIGVD